MRKFLQQRVLQPITTLLLQGVTPQKIALSIAIGAIVGVFPVLGTTTVLCTLSAVALRLNLVAVHAVHYAMTPVQIALIIPLVRVGEHALGATPQPLSISEGFALLDQGVWRAVVTLWDAILHAMLGWLLLGPAAIALAYFAAKLLLRRFAPVHPTSAPHPDGAPQ